MSKTYIYSLESEKLVGDFGVKNAMEVFSQLSEETNPEHKTELISSLMDGGYYTPMLSVKNDMDHMMSGQQTADIISLVGKTATMRSDNEYSFTKQFMDRPFWKVKENTVMISDGASIMIGKDGLIHEFDQTNDMKNVINNDFPDGEAKYFISMRGRNFSQNYEEAKSLEMGEGMKELPELLDESDRKTRIALTALAINTTLSLDNGANDEEMSPIDVVSLFSTIEEKHVEEYKDQVGLAMVNKSETMKDMWHSIDAAQRLTKSYHQHLDSNPDYVDNVILGNIDNLLEKTRSMKESTVVNSINSIEINENLGGKKRHFKGRSPSLSM